MKLKDLTVELSGNDNTRTRSLNIGPFTNGLNFIYGERGAGKSTLRNQIGDLLVDSSHPSSVDRTSVGCNSISLVVEFNEARYLIARSSNGTCSSTNMNNASGARNETVNQLPALDRELIDSVALVTFRDSGLKLSRLHGVLQNRYQVPVGQQAAGESSAATQTQQQRHELQNRIDLLQQEVIQLQSQRAVTESELEANRKLGPRTTDIDFRIRELTTRLAELDPARISMEIDTLQRESNRLRLEIQNATNVVSQVQPSRYLPTLYRLLDETDQQIREVRTIQSNVQRHRVRLKEEMEFRNGLTVDQENHPYHRACEILRQIEGRIDHADSRGDQWVEDQPTHDTKQVSRFLDETCRAVHGDLQLLCDELSTQYRELRNRSATHELKELRHSYNHLSELTQQVLARRDHTLNELRAADPQGADAIHTAAPEFCQLASTEGHLVARERYVGPISSLAPHQAFRTSHTRDTSLQQQQLSAIESRIASLQASQSMAHTEKESLTRQIADLNLQKNSLPPTNESHWLTKLANIDSRVATIGSEISSLNLQLSQLVVNVVKPHPLLLTASNILQHLTGGDFTRVWLSSNQSSIKVLDRHARTSSAETLEERGMPQLVQLSLVLAANEIGTGMKVPLILDDLFADLEKARIDETLETISRWCQQTFHQVIVLTQHRFLSDRIPDSSVWEIEPESNSEVWKPATRETLVAAENHTSNLLVRHQAMQPQTVQTHSPYVEAPIAEYPRSPLPRPYPLSKYPRTTDRERVSEFSNFDTYIQPELPSQSVAVAPVVQRASTVSPSIIGDRFDMATVNESTAIDGLGLFDNAQLRCLADNGIMTVGDFLNLGPRQDSSDFDANYLTGESLEHLHASAWLMMWVPGLAPNDAQALVACGISDPQHLLTSNVDSLFERVARFLRSPDGRRFSTTERTFSRDNVAAWQQRLRSNRNYRNQNRPGHRSDNRSDSRSENRSTRRQHALRAWSPQDRSNDRANSRKYENRTRGSNTRSDRQEPSHERSSVRRTVNREAMPIRTPRMQPPQNREPRRTAPPLPPREPRTRSSRSDTTRKPVAIRQNPGRQSLSNFNESSNVEPSTRSNSNSNSKSKSQSTSSQKLRFYLDLTDHIEAAPSIGPKTGARFEAIGVYTIADFLKMTAESLAEKLDYKRLNAKLLRQWQHQARLVCRIPNLRGHDAQLLVGCEIFEAEEVASMRPESLFAKIAPFSNTKEGLKIIRNGKKPDLAEITDWISFAQHNRSLRAA